MLAAGIKSPVPSEELEIHLREEIERQMKSGLKMQWAFDAAVRQVGQADVLQREFKKIERLLMKNKITITLSVAGLLAWLFMLNLCHLHVFGLSLAQFARHYLALNFLFWGGLALSFLGVVLAATSLPGHWRSGGTIGRFIWCCAILAGFYFLLAH